MLCDNLEGWDGVGDERGFGREGTYVYLWLIHVDVWWRPTQYCKAITLQFKKKEKKKTNMNSQSPFVGASYE